MTMQPPKCIDHDMDLSSQPHRCRNCSFSYYSNCTIIRTMVLNRNGKSEIVTRTCNTPLFEDNEVQTGVCSTCARGWQHPHNVFASKAERARALEANLDLCVTENAG